MMWRRLAESRSSGKSTSTNAVGTDQTRITDTSDDDEYPQGATAR